MSRSQTINGLIITAVGLIFSAAGVPLVSGELATVLLFLSKTAIVVGWVWAYVGRVSQRDVNFFGSYRAKPN